MYHWYDGDKALDEDKGLVCFKRCPPSEAPTLHTSSFHKDRRHRLCELPRSSSPHRYKCSVRRGLELKGRHGMFGRDADEASGVETAAWRTVNAHWKPPTFNPLHTQAVFLVCLTLTLTSPISQTDAYISPHLLSCLPHVSLGTSAPHGEGKKNFPSLSPFLPLSVSSFLTSTDFPPAWQHYPLNERIWLNKLNLKPKTGKLAAFVGHLPLSVPELHGSPDLQWRLTFAASSSEWLEQATRREKKKTQRSAEEALKSKPLSGTQQV